MDDPLPLLDRNDAGVMLARALKGYRKKKSAVVVGLLRGGVEVGRALSDELDLPLLPWNVRKIGHPRNAEYALGAIAEGGGTFLDEEVMEAEGLSFTDIEPIVEEELRELSRHKRAFPPVDHSLVGGKTVLLTDDGAATGATLFAALDDMRATHAKRVIVALPVCPPDTAARLRERADDAVILSEPVPFLAVGHWYLSFPQLTDEDVQRLLGTEKETTK
jgi:predicted phosphoribosyltransferase